MSSSQRNSSPSPASGRWRVDLEAEARPKALFICGSVNQTRQLHAISRALPEVAAYFSPYYADGLVERLRRLGLCDHTILGWPWRKKAMRYLRQHGLSLDHEGRRHGPQYELVVTCSDVLMPENIRGKKTVLVQEGITDPERFWFFARKVLPVIPRWTAGTAWTGASNRLSVERIAQVAGMSTRSLFRWCRTNGRIPRRAHSSPSTRRDPASLGGYRPSAQADCGPNRHWRREHDVAHLHPSPGGYTRGLPAKVRLTGGLIRDSRAPLLTGVLPNRRGVVPRVTPLA